MISLDNVLQESQFTVASEEACFMEFDQEMAMEGEKKLSVQGHISHIYNCVFLYIPSFGCSKEIYIYIYIYVLN